MSRVCSGQLWPNYEILRLFALKSNARGVLEIQESFSRCTNFTRYYKINAVV